MVGNLYKAIEKTQGKYFILTPPIVHLLAMLPKSSLNNLANMLLGQ